MITKLPEIDVIVPGRDSYVMPSLLPKGGDPGVARVWSFQGISRSSMWGAGGVVKTRHQFDAHPDKYDLLGLLCEALERGVVRPSSYADLFHSVYHSPKISGPVARALGMFDVAGGWQEMILPPGTYGGRWRKYDLRSAYLWSLTQGLPHPRSFRWSEKFGRKNGLYLCDVLPAIHAPYPFRQGGRLSVTHEDIQRYNLTVSRLWHGITWCDEYPVEKMYDAIMSWSAHKQIGRSYWGRWASKGIVTCSTFKDRELSKKWDMPMYTFNPVWGHLIVSRVRNRVWEASRQGNTARVYVDSIITTAHLDKDCGEIGDWKLEEEFTGLDIRHLNIFRSVA